MGNTSTNTLLRKVSRDLDTADPYLKVAGQLTVTQTGQTKELKTSQDLATGALSFETQENSDFSLGSVGIKFSDSVSETINITLTKSDPNYDTLIATTVLSGNTSFFYLPENEIKILSSVGQQLKVECTNVGGSETAYVTVNIEVI